MNLSLMIQVYNGGDYWRECWDSVIRNQDIFDQIYVSISKSQRQEDDIALIRDCKLEKLHWTRQDQYLTAKEHGMKFDRWVKTFHPKGHIFLLSHDDILLREGLLKLKELDLKETDAAYGPFHCFDQDKSLREMTVRQFHRQNNEPISGEFFSLLQENGFYFNNISGLVFPATLYQLSYPPWVLLRYGCRSEYLHLCNPYVKQIYQTEEPTVKIRIHQNSEGARQTSADYRYDTMLYFLNALVTYHNSIYRFIITRVMAYYIITDLPRGIFHFLSLQIRLRKLDYYYPEGLKVYGYLTAVSAIKIWKCIKRFLTV